MEAWRQKAIEFLKKSNDPDMQYAIKKLTDGKGYLTSRLPIRVIFFADINDDHAIK